MINLSKIEIADLCDKAIFICLCAVAFFLPISKAIIEVFSIAAILFYLVKLFCTRQPLPKTPLNLSIYIYLSICFFSIFISSNHKISARTFLTKTLQDLAFLFVIIQNLNSKRKIRTILYILFLSSLLIGIDGIYQIFTHKDFIRNRPRIFDNRIYASFATPNALGCYLSVIIPFVIGCLFLKLRFKFSKVLYTFLSLLLLLCLIFTVSRGAWFAFFGSVLFLSIWLKNLGAVFFIIGIIIIALFPFFDLLIKERLTNLFSFFDNSSQDRKNIWRGGWNMFMSSPLLGVGLGTFMFNFNRYIGGYHYIPYAHNCYLQISAELGITGLISFLFILGSFFINGIKILMNSPKSFYWYVLVSSLASILGYSIQMGVDTIFYSLDLGMLFWLTLGIGTAAMRNIGIENKKNIQSV